MLVEAGAELEERSSLSSSYLIVITLFNSHHVCATRLDHPCHPNSNRGHLCDTGHLGNPSH